MSRRGRRPVDYYEEEDEEQEEIFDDPPRRRRYSHERFTESEPEPEPESRRRPRLHLRREPTPPHLVREVDELIRLREKAREGAERSLRRSRGRDDDENVRRYEKEYLAEDNDERHPLPDRAEAEEMYLRRESLPRDRPRRKHVAIDDGERLERRISREDERLERRKSLDEEIILERQETSPRRREPSPVAYKEKFEEIALEDEKRRRRRQPKSHEVEEGEDEEQEDVEILVRRRKHSPLRDERIPEKLRRRSLLSQDERDEEDEDEDEERLFRHRDRSPRRHSVRDERKEVLLRHRDASLPHRDERERTRRRRSIPDYDEEEDDILIRHRERSGSGRDDDRDDVKVRRRERLHSHRDPEDDIREEIRVRRRHSAGNDEEEDEEREEILVHRSRGDHIKRSDDINVRDEPSRERVEFQRSTHSPLSVKSSRSRQGSVEREDIIRHSEHKGRGDRSKLERELSRESEVVSSSSSESSPESPKVIRKPPIVQEIITHHRHIESYEKAPPSQRHNVDDVKARIGVDEVEVGKRGDRNGDIQEENIKIEHRHQDRSPSLRPQSPVEEEKIIERSSSSDLHHGRGKEVMVLEREPARDYIAEESGRVKEKRKKRYTEVTKDLVVREAIERAGYEYDESEHDFYIYDYLRYDDVSRLVDMTEDIRQLRRERMRRERDIPPPFLPAAPRPPIREVYQERDVLVDGRRPRRRYRDV
ncbi:conserved glutamic acid rich protein [Talaromyces islandicus]|uniref:Conserved glutamic acid rich protein n=1 Tax=Talaromyces islandicus TaxID=28573 RepID=A0A0U1LWC5_TALIS|nr:conserved glutamic acid rich protein [Talaromyces islandicus]